MKPVVLLGNGRVARLAHFYLTHDSERQVAAFTVDRHHLTDDTLFGLPIVRPTRCSPGSRRTGSTCS